MFGPPRFAHCTRIAMAMAVVSPICAATVNAGVPTNSPTPAASLVPLFGVKVDVLAECGENKVLDPVVEAVTVDVVDDFSLNQWSSKVPLHDEPVFEDVPSLVVRSGDADFAVSRAADHAPTAPEIVVLSSLIQPRAALALSASVNSVVAGLGAELRPDRPMNPSEINSTGLARHDKSWHIINVTQGL